MVKPFAPFLCDPALQWPQTINLFVNKTPVQGMLTVRKGITRVRLPCEATMLIDMLGNKK